VEVGEDRSTNPIKAFGKFCVDCFGSLRRYVLFSEEARNRMNILPDI